MRLARSRIGPVGLPATRSVVICEAGSESEETGTSVARVGFDDIVEGEVNKGLKLCSNGGYLICGVRATEVRPYLSSTPHLSPCTNATLEPMSIYLAGNAGNS
jgi:hypothetical protein